MAMAYMKQTDLLGFHLPLVPKTSIFDSLQGSGYLMIWEFGGLLLGFMHMNCMNNQLISFDAEAIK